MIPALRSRSYAEDPAVDSAGLNRVLFEYLSQQATKQVRACRVLHQRGPSTLVS